MEKKEAAEKLYYEGVPQKDISKVLSVTERTVSAWVVRNNWKEKRVKKSLYRENSEEAVFELISYQTRVLKYKVHKWEKDFIELEKGKKDADDLNLIQRGDIDALNKLFASIKGKSLKWNDYVNIVTELINHIQNDNFKLAQSIEGIAHEFLNAKRKEL